MTRGKIIYINIDSQVYVSCEFNGDMHPHRHGEDIDIDIDIHTSNLLYDLLGNIWIYNEGIQSAGEK